MLKTTRFAALALLAALTSLAGVACGGSSLEKVDADDWVADVCDKALDFDDATTDAVQPLSEADEDDPGELKDAIDDMVSGFGEAIDDFIADVEDVGQPDIAGGDKVIKAFKDHAKSEKDLLKDFKSEVDDLDEDDDDFADQIFEILEEVDDADLRDRLEDIDEDDVDDLIDEIDDDPDCSEILFNS